MPNEVIAGVVFVPFDTANLMPEMAAFDLLYLSEIGVFRQRLEFTDLFGAAP